MLKKEAQKRLDSAYGKKRYTLATKELQVVASKAYTFVCKCKTKFTKVLQSILSKHTFSTQHCPSCRTSIGGCVARTTQWLKSQVVKIYGKGGYEVLGEYKTHKAPIKVRHHCGRAFSIQPRALLDADRTHCYCEANARRTTEESYRKQVPKVRPGFQVVKFVGTKNAVNTYKHLECGKTFKQTEASFRLSRHCPKCAGRFGAEVNRLKSDDIQALININHSGEYSLLSKYTRVDEPGKVVHASCGTKYSVDRIGDFLRGGYRCQVCYPNLHGSKVQEIIIRGKTFRVQGAEPLSLFPLVKKYGLRIITGCDKKRLRVEYKFKGKKSQYYPDFWIPKANLVVEVKSLATFGLIKGTVFGEDVYERNCAKAKQVIQTGRKFRMHLYNEAGKLVDLPKGWFKLSKQQFLQQVALT